MAGDHDFSRRTAIAAAVPPVRPDRRRRRPVLRRLRRRAGPAPARSAAGRSPPTPRSAPAAARPGSRPAGPAAADREDRRRVSVLFVDLIDFTPYVERADPELVRGLQTGFFAAARRVVGQYGGVVEKYIGDAVMALFGAPVATETDALRCVRAGLELQRVLARFAPDGDGAAALPGRRRHRRGAGRRRRRPRRRPGDRRRRRGQHRLPAAVGRAARRRAGLRRHLRR